MKLEFDSIEEVKDFVTKLKGTRGGKADKEEGDQTAAAPAPLAPPVAAVGFAPPAAGATQTAAGPFAAAANGPAPEVLALVARINVRIDGAIASGQPVDQALTWFRGECQKAGLDASNATIAQIKDVFLPKMPVPALEGIAKLMNA